MITNNITYRVGDILKSDAAALVNPVNCEGAVSGLAQQFKRAFPANYRTYRDTIAIGWLRLGRVLAVPVGSRYVVNLPTKDNPWQPAQIEWVRDGLTSLVEEVNRLDLKSVAIPPLGCGQGRLRWDEVRPLIEDAFRHLPDVAVEIYVPHHKLPGGKYLVPAGTPGSVHCGRDAYGFVPSNPTEFGSWGSPIKKKQSCPTCNSVHMTNSETLPCYARYLRHRLQDDYFAEAWLQLMESNAWLGCYCWQHRCETTDCILPECHTRTMAAIYALEGEDIAARLKGAAAANR